MMSIDRPIDTPTPPASSASPLRNLIPELLGYTLASGVALLVDVTVLAALVKQADWPLLAAASLAFIAGATVAYLLSVKFVFRHRRIERRPWEFGYFIGLGLVGLAVNDAMLFVAVSGAGLGLVVAKVLAAGATFATNFTLRRQILFAPVRMRG
jgi:putative flippase GtrA